MSEEDSTTPVPVVDDAGEPQGYITADEIREQTPVMQAGEGNFPIYGMENGQVVEVGQLSCSRVDRSDGAEAYNCVDTSVETVPAAP
jgi:hypothetical protein